MFVGEWFALRGRGKRSPKEATKGGVPPGGGGLRKDLIEATQVVVGSESGSTLAAAARVVGCGAAASVSGWVS